MGDSLIVKHKPNAPTRAKRKNETTLQRLWHYYNDTKRKTKLTDKQEHVRQMVEDAWLLYGTEYVRSAAINKLCAKHEIKPTRGRQIMKMAEAILGNPRPQIKAAKRSLHVDRIERIMKKLEDDGEWELHQKYATRYEKILGMEDPEGVNLEDLAKAFKGHTIVFTADEEILKQQAASLVSDVVDTDYTEVVEDGD